VNYLMARELMVKWKRETQRLRSPFFDYTNPEVTAALKSLMAKLSNHISIQREQMEPMLKKAIKDTLVMVYAPLDFFKGQLDEMADIKVLTADLDSHKRYYKLHEGIVGKVTEELAERRITESFVGDLLVMFLQALKDYTALVTPEVDVRRQFNVSDVLQPSLIFHSEEGDKVTLDVMTSAKTTPTIATPEVVAEAVVTSKPVTAQEEGRQSASQPAGGQLVDNPRVTTPPSRVADANQDRLQNLNESFAKLQQERLGERLAANSQNQQTLANRTFNARTINAGLKLRMVHELFGGSNDSFETCLNDLISQASVDESLEVLHNRYATPNKWDMSARSVSMITNLIHTYYVGLGAGAAA